ncbi:helix-turn-helix domain-containing protein [Nocardia sp. NPDC052254]|uniref:helix-turn-helix domain-containing protein n=1 Tax=Nocardia sp. NPDC052254 TaxID=3155681 RepID=UPI00341703B7
MSRLETARHPNTSVAYLLCAPQPGSSLTVEQLARATRMPEGTVYRAVRTLDNAGLPVSGVGLRRTAWQMARRATLRSRAHHAPAATDIPGDGAGS